MMLKRRINHIIFFACCFYIFFKESHQNCKENYNGYSFFLTSDSEQIEEKKHTCYDNKLRIMCHSRACRGKKALEVNLEHFYKGGENNYEYSDRRLGKLTVIRGKYMRLTESSYLFSKYTITLLRPGHERSAVIVFSIPLGKIVQIFKKGDVFYISGSKQVPIAYGKEDGSIYTLRVWDSSRWIADKNVRIFKAQETNGESSPFLHLVRASFTQGDFRIFRKNVLSDALPHYFNSNSRKFSNLDFSTIDKVSSGTSCGKQFYDFSIDRSYGHFKSMVCDDFKKECMFALEKRDGINYNLPTLETHLIAFDPNVKEYKITLDGNNNVHIADKGVESRIDIKEIKSIRVLAEKSEEAILSINRLLRTDKYKEILENKQREWTKIKEMVHV